MSSQHCWLIFLLVLAIVDTVSCQHATPVWFESFKEKYAQRVKQCRFLQGKEATYWQSCPRHRTGEYSCYFGEQQCGDKTFPTKRCDCVNGIWKCDKYKHCPKRQKAVLDQCPDRHPILSRYPFQCSMIGTVCEYDHRTCSCGMELPASLCQCTTEGTFQCQFQRCPKTCPTLAPTTTAPAPSPSYRPSLSPTLRPTTPRDAQVTLVIEFGENTEVDVIIKTEVVVSEEPEILLSRPFDSFPSESFANKKFVQTIDVTSGVLYRIEIRQKVEGAIVFFELCRGASAGKNDEDLLFRDSTPSLFNGNYFIIEKEQI